MITCLVSFVCMFTVQTLCMDAPSIVCGIAQETDIPALLALYEKAEVHGDDKNKIVILPSQIRERALCEAITKKRIFVAKANGKVVGFKKVFLVTEPNEREEILTQELRFTDLKVVTRALIGGGKDGIALGAHSEYEYRFQPDQKLIYNGSDFTHPKHRGTGINTMLSKHAFKMLLQEQRQNKGTDVALIFGLTLANAENNVAKEHSDRLPGIAKLFADSLREVSGNSSVTLRHYRTPAYMPLFKIDNGNVTISSDEESVPGFGNILELVAYKEML